MSLKKIILYSALLAAPAFPATAPSAMDVRLNSVGFIPHFTKKATVLAPASVAGDNTAAAEFSVKRAADNEIVFTGTTGPAGAKSAETDEYLWIADFTDFRDTGTYYIDVPGVGRSARFRIAGDAYVEAYRAMMLGMYLWRCGTAVSASYNGQTYSHAACHLNDGTIFTSGQTKNGTGGWHDAGDYNKYTVNSGVTVGMMLKAWEHFSPLIKNTSLIAVAQSGTVPAFLAEVKYNLEWVQKMQFTDSTVSHKLTTQNFGGMMTPENETATRYFTPHSTAATASFAAQMAIAYRIYKDADPQFSAACGSLALRSYGYLANHPAENVIWGNDGTPFVTGAYGASGKSYRLWAAAEMWEATGTKKYLDDFEALAGTSGLISQGFDWSDVSNLAAATYLLSERTGKNQTLANAIRSSAITTANAIVNQADGNKHGRTFDRYYWGANGIVARNVLVLHAAYKLTGEAKYAYAAQDAVSHLLGRNYYGRSFVTGVGNLPPLSPHDRTSVANGKPWPGRLIGGSHNSKSGNPAPSASISGCPKEAACWFDVNEDYWTNEVAINWNSAMIYALASLLPGSDFQQAPPAGEPNAVIRQAAQQRRAAYANKTNINKIVKIRGGKLDIPPGAKVYNLNGKLIAGKNGLPQIKRNGAFIVKYNNKP